MGSQHVFRAFVRFLMWPGEALLRRGAMRSEGLPLFLSLQVDLSYTVLRADSREK